MTLSAPSDNGPAPPAAEQALVGAAPSWRRRRSALLLAIAAQLIMIPCLVRANPRLRA